MPRTWNGATYYNCDHLSDEEFAAQNARAARHYEWCDCGAQMRLAARDYGTVWFCRECKAERITQFACLRGVN